MCCLLDLEQADNNEKHQQQKLQPRDMVGTSNISTRSFKPGFEMNSLAIVAVESFFFGFVDLFIRHPDLKRFMNVQYFHRHVSSDIPGNPHCFDYVLISLFNTLPEPSNFNMIWSNVYYTEPLILRGRIPLARVNSLTYNSKPKAGVDTFPCSVDLTKIVDKDGRFEVFIANDGDDRVKCPAGMYRSSSSNWERGFISMRNYLVAPGTVYESPELVRAADDVVIRKSEVLIAGSPSMKPKFMAKTKTFLLSRLAVFIVINFLNGFVLKRFVADKGMLCPYSASVLAIVMVFFISHVLTQQLYKAGRTRLAKQTAFCQKKNKFYHPDDDQAKKGSQPCSLHLYCIMQYDIPEGDTLRITSVINPADQKYWSLVLYDENGVSRPQYVHDASACKVPVASSSVPPDGLSNDQDAYSVDVRIVNDTPPARPHKDSLGEPHVTKLYVDKTSSKGYIMFRRVHPAANEKGSDSARRAMRMPESMLLGGAGARKDKTA